MLDPADPEFPELVRRRMLGEPFPSFVRVVRIGSYNWRVDTSGENVRGGGYRSTFCKIEWKPNFELSRGLSITGVEGPTPRGNALSCGQIVMHHWRIVKYAPGWSARKEARFRKLWKDYHGRLDVPWGILYELRALPETDRVPAWV